MDHGPQISWDDIAGLDFAKKTIKEIVIWPMLRPYVFLHQFFIKCALKVNVINL